MEAISKHISGDENLSVGVELPSREKLFPIPKSMLMKTREKGQYFVLYHKLMLRKTKEKGQYFMLFYKKQ